MYAVNFLRARKPDKFFWQQLRLPTEAHYYLQASLAALAWFSAFGGAVLFGAVRFLVGPNETIKKVWDSMFFSQKSFITLIFLLSFQIHF